MFVYNIAKDGNTNYPPYSIIRIILTEFVLHNVYRRGKMSRNSHGKGLNIFNLIIEAGAKKAIERA